VLRPGGRVAISDIIADQAVPQRLMDDPELWSGCISGAMEESVFIQAFTDAGFTAVRIDKWDSEPWQLIDGIEFRSITVTAHKPPTPPASTDNSHATVIYRGPYDQITTDSGHIFMRGQRTAVDRQSFATLCTSPYQQDFIMIDTTDGETKEMSDCCESGGCC
ncbi:MAG: hypothetical protein Q9M13_04135, partial [Mariprofundales bacterium]|nr:hypothetical protein [Mariprofundales bacterium]